MITAILIFLAIADVALIAAFYRLSKRQDAHQAVMAELTEERTMLSDLRSAIREDLNHAQAQVRSMKEQVQLLATEAEQEVKNGAAALTAEVDGIVSQLSARFEEPLKDMNAKQHYLEHLLQRVQTERKNFARTTERAGALAKFFKDGVQFDDVMREFEDKKFAEIRAMLAQGKNVNVISTELGVSVQEVRLVAGLR